MTTAAPTIAPSAARPYHLAALAPTLAIDVVAPIAIYDALGHAGMGPLWALAGAGLAPMLNAARTWIGSRRVEPLGLLVVGFGLIGAAASLASGNPFYSLVKDSILTSTFGLVFLASLLAPRLLVFVVLRQFVAGQDAARVQAWNRLWAHAAFRAAMRQLSVLWALVFGAEAALRVVLALRLPAGTVVTLSPLLGVGATVLLVVLSRRRLQSVRKQVAWTLD